MARMQANHDLDKLIHYLDGKLRSLGEPVEEVKCESQMRVQDFNYEVRCQVTYVEPNGRRDTLFCSRVISDRAIHVSLADDMYRMLEKALWAKIADFEYPEPPSQTASFSGFSADWEDIQLNYEPELEAMRAGVHWDAEQAKQDPIHQPEQMAVLKVPEKPPEVKKKMNFLGKLFS